jgi:predicted permease
MGIRNVKGRGFTTQDRMDAPLVAIASEAMAKQLWPGQDPVGHTVRMFKSEDAWVTIVGVAADVHSRGIQRESPPTLYFPYAQSGRSAYAVPTSMTLTIRSAGSLAGVAGALRAAVRATDPAIAISRVASMRDVVGDSIASRRFTTLLLGAFATLAVVLAGIGIYGVVSFGVAQRRYEIGVRMAMGASAAAIARLVLGESGRMAAVGLLVGLAGATGVQRALRSLLVGVHGADAPTYAGVVAVLAGVAVLACVVPARRAMSVNPTEALRND